MVKDKMTKMRSYIAKHCKKVFPLAVVLVVAVTVAVALGANRARGQEQEVSGQGTDSPQVSSTPESTAVASAVPTMAPEEVPLTVNTDQEVYFLIVAYYNSMAIGDVEKLREIHDTLSVEEALRFQVTSEFLEYYPSLDVYVKQGPEEGTLLACVYYKTTFVNYPVEFPGYQMLYLCRDEQGGLYIKNEENFTEQESEYIKKVIAQDDVIEFSTRIDVEYKKLLESEENQAYLAELGRQIDQAVGKALEDLGVSLAQENVGTGGETEPAVPGGEEQEPAEVTPAPTEKPAPAGPLYAVARGTVNVRSSDSEKADIIGSVEKGNRVQVQEVLVNGWTKVSYQGRTAYIKSEYLRLEEQEKEETVIGKVTAKKGVNLNIRSIPNTSGERLGLLVDGESLELLGEEGDWCRVRYNGRTAYVKTEFIIKELN